MRHPAYGSNTVPEKPKTDMKTAKSHIERMLRVTGYRVRLSCGHSFECSAEDVECDQLFIGKSVQCGKCLEGETERPVRDRALSSAIREK